MRRRLFTLASAVSLLLCVAAVLLWVRSYRHEDVIIRRRGGVPSFAQPKSRFGGGVFGGFGDGGGFRPQTTIRNPNGSPPDQPFISLGSSSEHSLCLTWSKGWWRSGGHLTSQSQLMRTKLIVWGGNYINCDFGLRIRAWEYGGLTLPADGWFPVGSNVVVVELPFKWAVLVTSLLPLARVATFLRWKGTQWGHCTNCSYNLTGNTSGICPECGTAVTLKART